MSGGDRSGPGPLPEGDRIVHPPQAGVATHHWRPLTDRRQAAATVISRSVGVPLMDRASCDSTTLDAYLPIAGPARATLL